MVIDGHPSRRFPWSLRASGGKWLILTAFAAATGQAVPGDAQASSLNEQTAKAIIAPFYAALAAASPETMERNLNKATAADWQNCGTNDLCETRAETLARWAKRPSIVPNLHWDLQDILLSGDRIIVRGLDTGTPIAQMLGIAPKGRTFSIMTIDIHKIRGDKIIRSYHVEDWARAIQQMSAP